MNWANQPPQIDRKVCGDAHRVDNTIPQSTDLYFDNRICDCGRLRFYIEKCTCPSGGPGTLKSKPNE